MLCPIRANISLWARVRFQDFIFQKFLSTKRNIPGIPSQIYWWTPWKLCRFFFGKPLNIFIHIFTSSILHIFTSSIYSFFHFIHSSPLPNVLVKWYFFRFFPWILLQVQCYVTITLLQIFSEIISKQSI